MTQREEFEKWAGLRDFELSSAPVNYHPTYLEYDSEVTESSWQAYQAATQSNIDALKSVREILKHYAMLHDTGESRITNEGMYAAKGIATLNRLIGEA